MKIQHLQVMSSQRSSLRQRTTTTKMKEYLEDREANKDAADKSVTPVSSDDDYESSQFSTPSRSRENSVSSPTPPDEEDNNDNNDEGNMKRDSFPVQPNEDEVPRKSNEGLPLQSDGDSIEPGVDIVKEIEQPTKPVPTQLLLTPDKPQRTTIQSAAASLKELQEHQIQKEEEPSHNKTPQPPKTPRPQHTRTPNLRTPSNDPQKNRCEGLMPSLISPIHDEETVKNASNSLDITSSDASKKADSMADLPTITVSDTTGTDSKPSELEGASAATCSIRAVQEPRETLSPDPLQKSITWHPSYLERIQDGTSAVPIIIGSLEPKESPQALCRDTRGNTSNIETTMQGILISNLPGQVIEEDISKLLGLRSSDYLTHFCSCNITDNVEIGRYAFITAPTHVAAEVVNLNGIEYYSKIIEMKTVPLQFLEIVFQNEGKNKDLSAANILDFFFDDVDENKKLSRCDILGPNLAGKSNGVAIIATALTVLSDDKLSNADISIIDSTHYYNQLNKLFIPKSKIKTKPITKKDQPLTGKASVDKESVEQLLIEIRNYDMNLCKQMKRKLNYLSRPNFQVNHDRGSAKKEQVYIECSTANYEYLRRYLVMILVDLFRCEEDIKKRRVRCDKDEKSEVEAQYSIHFWFDQLRYTISITLYYTKCSLWIQGPSTQIDGMALAQFFVVNYLEKVSKMIERSVSLKAVSETLRQRITSFIGEEEARELTNNVETESDHCVSCSRRCANNNKSIRCSNCQGKQHFKCASVNDESQRQMYLTGGEIFICNRCFSEVDVNLLNSPMSPPNVSSMSPQTVQRTITNAESSDMSSSLCEAQANIIINGNETSKIATTRSENNDRSTDQQTNYSVNLDMNSTEHLIPSNNTTPISDHSNTVNHQQQEDGIRENHDGIMIRRLQAEITRLKADHIESKRKMEVELGSLREAYRQSCANYEREKETKNALQQCVETLQKQQKQLDDKRGTSSTKQPSAFLPRGDIQQKNEENRSQVRMQGGTVLHPNLQQQQRHAHGRNQQFQHGPQQPDNQEEPLQQLLHRQVKQKFQQQPPQQNNHQQQLPQKNSHHLQPIPQHSYQQQPNQHQRILQQQHNFQLLQQQQLGLRNQQSFQHQNYHQQPLHNYDNTLQQSTHSPESQHQRQEQSLPRCRFHNTRKGCQRHTCKFPHIDGPPDCRFFNSKKGCQRQNCNFPHVVAPPCRYLQDCRRKRCRFNHGSQINSTRTPGSDFLDQGCSPNWSPTFRETTSNQENRQTYPLTGAAAPPLQSSNIPQGLNCNLPSSSENLIPSQAQAWNQGNSMKMNNPILMKPAHYQPIYPGVTSQNNNLNWTAPQTNTIPRQ